MGYKRYHGTEHGMSEDSLIDRFAFPNAIIAPSFAFIWIILHEEMPYLHKVLFGANACLYIYLYIFVYVNRNFYRYRRAIYQVAYMITNTIAFQVTFTDGFKVDHTMMLMMVSSYICLCFESFTWLCCYLVLTVVSLVVALVIRINNNQYNAYEVTFVICFIVLAVAAIIIRRIRDKDLRNLYNMAHYDSITGLANRRYLQQYLFELIEEATAYDQKFAILFIDIDNFKKINDTMGHYSGDIVLAQVAGAIHSCLAEEDFLAKYGGDEFVAILKNPDPNYSEQVAISIIERFSKSILEGEQGKGVEITASLGISLFPKDAQTAEELLQTADKAMYYGKARGKHTYNFYHQKISEDIARKVFIEESLLNALEREELEMYYQPEVEIDTGRIISAEALIRWNHPKKGLIFPGDFIPLAEENGLIIPIGEWVLSRVLRQNKEWQEMGLQPIRVAVNVSYHQLTDKNFMGYLKKELEESGLEPQYLELEITESILREVMDFKSIIDELKPLGIKLALDDFGVGYSSLSIIQHIDFHNLKIDKAFISEIPFNQKAADIIKTIIGVGKILDHKVTAEGVETTAQFEFLKKNKCNYGQGYLFSTPLNAKQFAQLLADWETTQKEWRNEG